MYYELQVQLIQKTSKKFETSSITEIFRKTYFDMKSPLKTVWTRYGKSIDLVDWDFFQKEIVPPKFEDINFCEVNPRSLIPI